MRRSKQQLTDTQCLEVLERATSGVLALNDAQAPYQVPLSFAYANGTLIFHGAVEGKKTDLIEADGRASFTVIDHDEVVPERFTTVYRSVVCTGKIALIEDADARHDALMRLGERYWPGHVHEAEAEIADSFAATTVMVLTIEKMTGKASMQLINV